MLFECRTVNQVITRIWKIVNATPHDINLMDASGNVIARYPASGRPIRLTERRAVAFEMPVEIARGAWIAVPIVTLRHTAEMPREETGVYYIVSAMVANAYPERRDLLTIDGTVRDERGQMIGCRGFATRGTERRRQE